jgi:hypothetical protein
MHGKDEKSAKKILNSKYEMWRTVGRLRHTWEDVMKWILKKCSVRAWTGFI